MAAGRGARRAGATIIAGLALAGCDAGVSEPSALSGADPDRGRDLIEAVGCGACHHIPGIRGPRGRIGPPLAGFGDRALIAGRFPNEPETLARWVRDAPSLSPRTGMPPMPLDETQARDVAAYLGTLRDD